MATAPAESAERPVHSPDEMPRASNRLDGTRPPSGSLSRNMRNPDGHSDPTEKAIHENVAVQHVPGLQELSFDMLVSATQTMMRRGEERSSIWNEAARDDVSLWRFLTAFKPPPAFDEQEYRTWVEAKETLKRAEALLERTIALWHKDASPDLILQAQSAPSLLPQDWGRQKDEPLGSSSNYVDRIASAHSTKSQEGQQNHDKGSNLNGRSFNVRGEIQFKSLSHVQRARAQVLRVPLGRGGN
ncbi:hypothetical protein Efla_005188 [Eimeria flavescens]